jgi:hypothetical protein
LEKSGLHKDPDGQLVPEREDYASAASAEARLSHRFLLAVGKEAADAPSRCGDDIPFPTYDEVTMQIRAICWTRAQLSASFGCVSVAMAYSSFDS